MLNKNLKQFRSCNGPPITNDLKQVAMKIDSPFYPTWWLMIETVSRDIYNHNMSPVSWNISPKKKSVMTQPTEYSASTFATRYCPSSAGRNV